MSDIRIIKAKKKKPVVNYDPKKESLIKELSTIAEGSGIQVRREHLKQGLGWKVISGSCRANEKQIIFVDRKMTQSDQVSFLMSKFMSLKIVPSTEQLSAVSEEARQLFAAKSEAEAASSASA